MQHGPPTIFVVDDDRHVRDELRSMLEDSGRTVELFASCEAFLDAYRPGREGTLLIDAYLPGMSGIELLQRLNAEGPSIAVDHDHRPQRRRRGGAGDEGRAPRTSS